jgi:aminoglycoside phosphotransferase (APT) family kinase protein
MAAPDSDAASFDAIRKDMFCLKSDIDWPDDALRALARARAPAAQGGDDGIAGPPGAAFGGRCSQQRLAGTFHEVYLASSEAHGRHVVRVPVCRSAFFNDLLRVEAHVASAARDRGIPVPRISMVQMRADSGPAWCHVVEYLPGVPLSHSDDDEAATAALLRHLVRWLRALHAVGGEGFGPVSLAACGASPERRALAGVHRTWPGFVLTRLEAHVAACLAMAAIDRAEREQILSLFSQAEAALASRERPALLHGDLGGHNVLVADGRIVGLIDWEDSLLGDPLFDFAGLATFHPRRRHDIIIEACGIAGRAAELRLFWLYYLRIALAKTVHRQRFGYLDRPGHEVASGRIQIALAQLGGIKP